MAGGPSHLETWDPKPLLNKLDGQKRPAEFGDVKYKNGFLPSVFQPTFLRPGTRPVLNLELPEGVKIQDRRQTIELIRAMNETGLPGENAEFAARMSAYDTAFRMQTEAPEVFDLTEETKDTRDLYGIDDAVTGEYGRPHRHRREPPRDGREDR